MSRFSSALPRGAACLCFLALASALVFAPEPAKQVRACFVGGFVNRSVGGVAISPEGVLEAPTEDQTRELNSLRQKMAVDVPDAMAKFTELRAVSLKQLEATIARCNAQKM